ncbi:hypothetical protein BRW64_12745 [Mycolicibacterium diernhoferi]|uniref:Uncharacterized protein n=1 Tax=Mycolicibacterium diernhoferi TaxID=1801 RepID=A0A1Q4HD15_9MYCO|nr:hypothetical protein BRW64_12745 [Mycolicibacterium diernhoferi]OPE55603.1 hypothetical protein BV510_04215 [Mycolicibacterium diernhoferi]PEG52917.1 hypothetical protein CRI78_19100 [Mycolicibacterium diernhoferi]
MLALMSTRSVSRDEAQIPRVDPQRQPGPGGFGHDGECHLGARIATSPAREFATEPLVEQDRAEGEQHRGHRTRVLYGGAGRSGTVALRH